MSDAENRELEYHVADHIATITLNRPHRKNAFTVDVVDAWADALRSAQTVRTYAWSW